MEIIGQTHNSYILDGYLDRDKYISVEVTPNNLSKIGLPVESSTYYIVGLDGRGTVDDPFYIETLDDLKLLSEMSFLWDKYLLQIEHIDASITSGWNNGAGFNPIGTDESSFSGQYDGGDYTIHNLYINQPREDGIALFKNVRDASLKNIHLKTANISGRRNVSALLGSSTGSSHTKITNVRVTNSKITGYGSDVGSIGGYLQGTFIRNSYSIGNEIIGNKSYTGGLVGFIFGSSSIENCYSISKVNGMDNAGGLVGAVRSGSTVNQSYSSGIVIGDGINMGGLIGSLQASTVTISYYDIETSIKLTKVKA